MDRQKRKTLLIQAMQSIIGILPDILRRPEIAELADDFRALVRAQLEEPHNVALRKTAADFIRAQPDTKAAVDAYTPAMFESFRQSAHKPAVDSAGNALVAALRSAIEEELSKAGDTVSLALLKAPENTGIAEQFILMMVMRPAFDEADAVMEEKPALIN